MTTRLARAGGRAARAPALAVVLAGALSLVPGCFPRRGGHVGLIATTALITAAIVSSTPPPPPRVVYAPPPTPGYVWQEGYWTRYGNEWRWVDGRWIAVQPGYQWLPTHWEQGPDGTWRLIAGQWVPNQPPPPPY
jgi:hypothetical protein